MPFCSEQSDLLQNYFRFLVSKHSIMFSYSRATFLTVFFLLATSVSAQKVNDEFILYCNRAAEEIDIDGVLEETTWLNADVAKDFHMIQPMDTALAEARTEVRVAYDDKNFYMAAICYITGRDAIIVESLKRDFSFNANDNFFCVIDPFNDLTNGFSFGSNAVGAEWDGQQSDGGRINLNWDNKWKSKVRIYEDRWILEAAIPFKTLRYKKGIESWGINFSRLDLARNEKSAWAPVPRQFPSSTLAFTGNMIWDEPPPPAGTNISLIPYVRASTTKNNEEGTPVKNDFEAGFDAKVSITPALNFDLTVNSDFSQVEVDRQVTNLSRFELFFPERRQFFLENSDLFAGLGFRGVRPFFSRRIGLQSPIQAGGRLSGKLNEDWRIGLMNIQTGATDAIYNADGSLEEGAVPVQNYAVAVLQRQLFARSNITASFINKQSLNLNYARHDSTINEYNRDLGLEYNLYSSNNLWRGKFLVHKSFTPDSPGNDLFHVAQLQYDAKNFAVEYAHEYVGTDYNAEVGFIPRTGYLEFAPDARYTFFPNSNKLVSHGPQFDINYIVDMDWDKTDSRYLLVYDFEMLNRSSFGIGTSHNYIRLLDPFDPTNSGGEELPTGSEFAWWDFGFQYNSTPKRLFTYNIGGGYGGYFNGTLLSFDGELGYRFQPYGSINVDFSYNDIKLPEPYTSVSYWLISPRLELTFTNKIFFTTFVQYNEQEDNINLNARFQWRFLPASDFFLVYTENYLPKDVYGTPDLSSKNRALVLKFTYWYNI
jgi:hypothetical protein